jgi:hypothetical protein
MPRALNGLGAVEISHADSKCRVSRAAQLMYGRIFVLAAKVNPTAILYVEPLGSP